MLGAAAVYVAARLWHLDASCLWFDEVFSVHAAWHGWGALLRFVALDLIHPPLFYLLLKLWLTLVGSNSIWWLRLFSVLASTLALVPLVLLARKLRLGHRAIGLALLLAAASGTLIKYAQELRMYSLLWLFAACSLWLFARFHHSAARAARSTLPLAVCNLFLVYTHYFGWLLIALELAFLALFARRKLKFFAASVAVLALCFAPWAWAVARAVREADGGFAQNLGWAERPRLLEIFSPFLALHEPFRARQQSNESLVLPFDALLALLIFAPPLAALCRRTFTPACATGDAPEHDASRDTHFGQNLPQPSAAIPGSDERPDARFAVTFLLFFSFAPVIAAFTLALALPYSVWGTRHLIIVAPAYLLLAAHALDTFRPVRLALACKVMLVVWLSLAAAFALTRRDTAPIWCAWETLVAEAFPDKTSLRDDATRAHDANSLREAAGASAETFTRDDAAGRGATKIYAFEDLVAYQLWYALRSRGMRGLHIAVVRGLHGVVEDRAFFLPRGFDEVSAEDADAAMRDKEFWVAFREPSWKDEDPLLKTLHTRGYEAVRRFELHASGQKAFIILLRRG